MIRITHRKIVIGNLEEMYPKSLRRTTVWLFWVVPVFVIEREI